MDDEAGGQAHAGKQAAGEVAAHGGWQEYRELVKKYPTFRERSEIPEVATEISLQPWEAYGVDGCILFSDILTPLPGMGQWAMAGRRIEEGKGRRRRRRRKQPD